MTQAFNLALLANAVDTSGRLNVGTNATGVLPVANGGTGLSSTPSNGQLNIGNGSGFTRATLTQGSGISITNGAGSITIAATGSGTVTSVATGNGLQGGTITTSGTLSIAAPGYNTVGSYVNAFFENGNPVAGSNYAGGMSTNQIAALSIRQDDNLDQRQGVSGTWRWMAANGISNSNWRGLACRVS